MIFAESMEERDEIEDALLKKWITNDKGEIGCVLGLGVKRSRRAQTAFVSQAGYCTGREGGDEGAGHDIQYVRQRSTAMEVAKCVQLDAPVEEEDLVDQGKYLQAVRKLLYLHCGTVRSAPLPPDLSVSSGVE